MSRSNNLQRRSNGVYYLRVYVPSDLVCRFGCREITRSLGTNCRRQAEHLAITMKAQVYLAMDMAKKDPELSKGELRQIAKRQYDEGVARAEERYLGTKFKPGEKEHWADELQDMIDRMKSILNAHDFEDDQVERLVGRVLESEVSVIKTFGTSEPVI